MQMITMEDMEIIKEAWEEIQLRHHHQIFGPMKESKNGWKEKKKKSNSIITPSRAVSQAMSDIQGMAGTHKCRN